MAFLKDNVMPEDEKMRSAPQPGARPRGKASSERPFDKWLQKQLHAMYDEIANEPLPQDLLVVIDRDAASDAASQDGTADGRASKDEDRTA